MPRLRALPLVIAIGVTGVPAVAAGAEDPWLGRDKALHFGASFAIAAGGYALAAPFTDLPVARAAVGGGLALAAGIGKEAWDANGAGDASWRDFTWDLVGTATGLLVAATVDWIFSIARRPSDRRPAPSGLAP